MKIHSLLFFSLVVFCLMLSGCNSDNNVDKSKTGEVTLYADYGSDSGFVSPTRTVIDASGNQTWSLTDVINVNGQTSTSTAMPSGNVYAAFTVTATKPYYAFYPGNATNLSYSSSSHTFTYTFPSTQSYNSSAGYSFSNGVNPMVAVGSNIPYLSFYNVCGLLSVQIVANISGVSAVRFLSADKAVAGTATVTPTSKTLTVSGTTLSMDVTFTSAQTLTSSSPLTVSWVLPTGTYGAGWQIQLLDSSGNVLSQYTFPTAISISRSCKSSAGVILFDNPGSSTPSVVGISTSGSQDGSL